MTDNKGYPIGFGDVISGNHNDVYKAIDQLKRMFRDTKKKKIKLDGNTLNMDKSFDCQLLRRLCFRQKVYPNVMENKRNRKQTKRGRKRFFDANTYKQRFTCERTFAWMDSYRTLLIRFERLALNWLSWHFLAAAWIFLKV